MQEGEALSAVRFLRKLYAQWRVEKIGEGMKSGKVVAGPARRVKDRCR